MRSLRPFILTTTALVTLGAAYPALAQDAPAAGSSPARYLHLSDNELLEKLIQEYRTDPTTYEKSIEYIALNRPAIQEPFLMKTSVIEYALATTQPERYRALGPKAGPGAAAAGVAPVAASPLALAAVGAGVGAAIYLSVRDEEPGEGSPIPPDQPIRPDPPNDGEPPVEGDPDSFRTSEYYSNYGNEAIGAASRYAQGPQGQGVKISVLDTGIDTDNSEFAGKIDIANSYSYFNNAGSIEDTGGHGSHVAGTIAAAKNDQGTHGVAFGSDLVIFKGIPGDSSDGATTGNVWADAMNRSVDAGAFAMNNSWNYVRTLGDGSTEAIPITDFANRDELSSWLGTGIINALDNAVTNDLLVITATGNDGADQVAVNAGVPVHLNEYAGYMIAVTATDDEDQIASFANRCGVARDHCLAAPGQWINSTANDGGVVTLSGTSMATPHVTGAAAVLKSQNPELTAPEVAQILFDTATDLGAAGVDDVYGHGLLNLGEAQAPQGNLVIYAGDNTSSGKYLLNEVGIIASPAMGNALTAALSGQSLMVGDKYDRAYNLDADHILSTSSAALPSATLFERTKIDERTTVTKAGSGFAIAYDDGSVAYSLAAGSGNANSDTALSPLDLNASDFGADYSVALADGIRLNAGFSGAAGSHTAARVGVEAGLGHATLSARFGTMEEQGTVLGSQFLGAGKAKGTADTAYIELSGSFDISSDTYFTLTGTKSETSFTQAGLVTGGRGLEGTAAKLALSRENFLGGSGTFTASLSSPLQVTSGEITVDLPQSRTASSGGMKSTGVERKATTVAFEQNARPYDLGFSYAKEIDESGLGLSINAGYRAQGAASTPFLGLQVSKKF